MSLFDSSKPMSLGGNYHTNVIVDYFSISTWTLFLASKINAFIAFKEYMKLLQNRKKVIPLVQLKVIMGEWVSKWLFFCKKHGIMHNIFTASTQQQIGRKKK